MKFFGAVAFAAGLALFAWLLVHFGTSPIVSAWKSLGADGLAIVVAAHLPVAVILGLAWWSLQRGHARASPEKFVMARLVRDGAAEALPFSQLGGLALGARVLTMSGASGILAAVSTLVDAMIELTAKFPYLLIGLALLGPRSGAFAPVLAGAAAGGGLILLVAIFRDRGRIVLEWLARRAARRWPSLSSGDGELAPATISGVLARDGRTATAFGLHFIAWMLGALEAWIAFHLMGAQIGLAEAFVIDSLFAGLRTFAFLVPAAIGVQEAAYVALCALFGIPPGFALAFSLARRARDLLIAAPCLVIWQMAEARRALFSPTAPVAADD